MPSLSELTAAIARVDPSVALAVQRRLDLKTKPRGSLGRLEELACRIAAIRGTTEPTLGKKAIVVMGADHGVAEEGVSAYPQAVTAQMLLNFARGGAAINVLARHAGARVLVVDMGVKEDLPPLPEIRRVRIGPGTQNFVKGPAMSEAEALRAIAAGAEIARELCTEGYDLLGIGEMGIGNTTSASALTAALTGAEPETVTGLGTGIDAATRKHKIAIIRRGLERNAPDARSALDALRKLGGFEIAGLCGVVLGAAAERAVVVIDGFIASVAALCAVRFAPAAQAYLVASHRSVEVGHRLVLEALQTTPLLDLELRLGEGTGSALAMHLVEASLCILREMATFESAGVTDAGA